jgi:hypothetical protein
VEVVRGRRLLEGDGFFTSRGRLDWVLLRSSMYLYGISNTNLHPVIVRFWMRAYAPNTQIRDTVFIVVGARRLH